MRKILAVLLLIFLTYGTAQAQFGGPFGDLDNLVLDTDCSGYTTEGLFCWDTDDDFLYIGTGSGVSAVGSTADDTAYNATTWDSNTDAATKNALRDKIETLATDTDLSTHNTDEAAHPTLLAVGVVSHTDATVVLTTAQCQDGYHYNGDDDVIDFTLPAVAVGLSCCFDANLYSRVITVDPAGSNVLILDGVALTAGNAVDTAGTVDEKFCVVGRDATYWTVINGTATLTDGGAD